MYACLKSIPDSVVCDGIFFNYYRHDIRSIQFLALATHKAARLKWDVVPIPENIARQFDCTDNFSTQLINDLSQDPLTEYVVSTSFRNIKSLILMRMHLDGLRLGALGVFSYRANAFTPQHVELFESVRGELSLLAFIALSRHNLLARDDALPQATPVPALLDVAEDEPFVVSPANGPLYQLYTALDELARSEQPVLILGEEGVGKKTFAACLLQRMPRHNGWHGVLDAIGSRLIIIKDGETERSVSLDFSQPPDIALFLPLHQGSLQINELLTLPECWQTFLLRLASYYRAYCRIQVIALQTQSFSSAQVSHRQGGYDAAPCYLTSRRYGDVFCQVITLPPLRHRHEDIPLLLTHYLTRLARLNNRTSLPVLGNETQRLLWEYRWPGNISELIALLENAFFQGASHELNISLPGPQNSDAIVPLDEAMRQHILLALRQCQGKISGKGGAAELLGVNSNTLYSKIKKLGIIVK